MTKAIRHTLGNTSYFIRYYWKHIAIFSIIALVILGSLTSIAFADVDAAAGVAAIEDGSKFDPLLRMAFDWIDAIVGPEVIEDAGNLLSVYYDGSEIHVGPYSSSGAGVIMNAAYSITCIVALIGLCIAFFVDLAMMRTNDMNEENFFRKLLMFVIGMLLIGYSMNFCLWIANIGTGVTNAIIEKMTDSSNDALIEGIDSIKQTMYLECHSNEIATDAGIYLDPFEWLGNVGSDIGARFSFILQLLLPYLATKLAWFIISVVCFSRAIELFVMSGFAPLAFMDSNTIDNFTTSPGWRFLKNIIAISIQGGIIAGVLSIGSSFTVAVVGSSSGNIGEFIEQSMQVVMITFAEVSMVTRSQGIAKSVLAIG